mmetsp:Transcript_57974/g.141650  ORF Transcript_57974/g.141650 Transcript_57974/m.141650 type:complete len:106 (+) Transcript_57974:2264-2581(+)
MVAVPLVVLRLRIIVCFYDSCISDEDQHRGGGGGDSGACVRVCVCGMRTTRLASSKPTSSVGPLSLYLYQDHCRCIYLFDNQKLDVFVVLLAIVVLKAIVVLNGS